ncbi:MAG: hypothetical protein LBV68_07880 [Spirochaetaceae bacterium]|nr:hypothetical protein [Spirochaetaceae bacterium]
MKETQNKSKTLVKTACVIGLFVFIAFLGLLVWAFISSISGPVKEQNPFDMSSFNENLKTFDLLFAQTLEEGFNPDTGLFEALLASLEKAASGAEEHLSPLKRRRMLAKAFPSFIPDYFFAAERSFRRFPHSAPLAAIAGEALVLYAASDTRGSGKNVINPDSRQKLMNYAQILSQAGVLSEKSFLPLAFSFYVLSDSLSDIPSALRINRIDDLFSFTTRILLQKTGAASAVTEGLSIDLSLLKILDNKAEEANAYLIPFNPGTAFSRKSSDFFANYEYDFGNLLLAAQIWTESGKEEDLARAADALYLANMPENARQLWSILTEDRRTPTAGDQQVDERFDYDFDEPFNESFIDSFYENDEPLPNKGSRNQTVIKASEKIRFQSFYNLASSATRTADKRAPLENILAEAGDSDKEIVLYSIILYTRMLEDQKARLVLKENPLTEKTMLLDLELFRRSLTDMPLERSIADTWLVLDRHNDDERLYQWAAWYFDYERRFNETDFLVKLAEKREIIGEWLPFNKGIFYMRAGDYASAAKIFESSMRKSENKKPSSSGDLWTFPANLGLIREAEHNFSAALDNFTQAVRELQNQDSGIAFDKKKSNEKAARLQLKIARCFGVLGRKGEAREAILKAAELDGSNINVRIVLDRL